MPCVKVMRESDASHGSLSLSRRKAFTEQFKAFTQGHGCTSIRDLRESLSEGGGTLGPVPRKSFEPSRKNGHLLVLCMPTITSKGPRKHKLKHKQTLADMD